MKSLPSPFPRRCEPRETPLPLEPPIASATFTEISEPILQTGMFSMFDQAVVSGTNFLTTLMIARACSQDELGAYSLAWAVVLFLAAVQGNLISVPYTIYCHRRDGHSLAEYAGSTLMHQLITSVAAVTCVLGLGLVLSLGIGPPGVRPVAWVLLGAIPFILLRDFARRFSFAHLALRTAIAMDIIVSLLQLGSLLVLWRLHLLSAAAAYVAMGGACAVACFAWWLGKGQAVRFSRRGLAQDWRQNWSFGKWALAGQLTGLAFYALPWLLAAVHGEAETGEFAACATLVGLSNLFVMGLSNFLTPKTAHAFARRGVPALRGVLRKAMLLSMGVLGSLCVAAFFLGDFVAGILFGPEYTNTGMVITVLALATLADALVLTASTGLWAMDRPAANLRADLVQMFVTLAAALWLVAPHGRPGHRCGSSGGSDRRRSGAVDYFREIDG